MILLATFLSASDLLAQTRSFDAFEMTIPELQAAMARGETTSRELVRQYLERIDTWLRDAWSHYQHVCGFSGDGSPDKTSDTDPL